MSHIYFENIEWHGLKDVFGSDNNNNIFEKSSWRAACLKLTVIALTQLCDNCLLGSTLSKVSRYIKLIKRIVKKIRIFIPRLAIFEFILYLEWLEGKSIKAIVLTQQHQLGFTFLASTDWDAWAIWLISWYADMTYRNNHGPFLFPT